MKIEDRRAAHIVLQELLMARLHIGGLLLSLLFPSILLAQSPQTVPPSTTKPAAFEASDIHPSPFSFTGKFFHLAPFTGNRFVAHQATPLDLITTAYKVDADAVTGGPPGLAFDRYDIAAKLPAGTKESDTQRMLQSLLTDRFKLVAEAQTKPLPSFLLKLGKGANKMKPAADPASGSDCQYHPSTPETPNTQPPPTVTLNCTNMTMEQFAEELRDFGWQSLNHPVVDTTGLKGTWDFDFLFTWQPGTPGALTLFDSVDKLGLKLEAGTAPRPAIAITSMAETPTPNVSGIEKLLPPLPPPSFEVAVIRPNKSEWKDYQVRIDGSQVTVTATQLRLISFAWDISVKTVFDGPAFFDNQVWEVTGKLPTPDTPLTPGSRPRIDFDQVRLMMRSLLAERFGLKTHTEDRPGMAYTLYAGTPRLKPANPANRASCTDRPAPGEKDPQTANPYLTQYTHCDNVTMDQFAREFQAHSGYIVKSPVLNRTGIEGRYDVTLSFSALHTLESLGIVPNANGQAPTAAGGEGGTAAGDPTGVPVMLTDAVAKQLGLKLVFEKRPISVLVVDHIEEKPTDN
jgi:uncharacterized protein (TIGR03435 family)